MRGGFRIRHREEEEESVFVSMTDMTVGFLFIVMLLLAYFASQYSTKDIVPRSQYEDMVRQRNDERTKVSNLKQEVIAAQEETKKLKAMLDEKDEIIRKREAEIVSLKNRIQEKEREISELQKQLEQMKRADPLEAYLAMSALERKKILETLRDQLKIDFPDLKVVISEENDALRFQGDGLFDTGSATLRPDRRSIVESVATRLSSILPCYTIGALSKWEHSCNPGNAIIEALQIEGHTDSTGNPDANLALSTNRANSTFFTMTERAPNLVGYLNFRKQPVLSVAGYGQMRPVGDNGTREGRDTNRRVDLRIIMYTPSKSAEIDRIRAALNGQLKSEPAN